MVEEEKEEEERTACQAEQMRPAFLNLCRADLNISALGPNSEVLTTFDFHILVRNLI